MKSGEISAYKASKLYNVPRSTIINHVNGKSKGFNVGRPPIFNTEQERLVLDFILTPQNIFNVDETNMSACSLNTRVFCQKGSNRINKLAGNNEKLNYTIQVSFCQLACI